MKLSKAAQRVIETLKANGGMVVDRVRVFGKAPTPYVLTPSHQLRWALQDAGVIKTWEEVVGNETREIVALAEPSTTAQEMAAATVARLAAGPRAPRCECVVPPEACSLHAAAPELLEALVRAFGFIDETSPKGKEAADNARAAIAKARGE